MSMVGEVQSKKCPEDRTVSDIEKHIDAEYEISPNTSLEQPSQRNLVQTHLERQILTQMQEAPYKFFKGKVGKAGELQSAGLVDEIGYAVREKVRTESKQQADELQLTGAARLEAMKKKYKFELKKLDEYVVAALKKTKSSFNASSKSTIFTEQAKLTSNLNTQMQVFSEKMAEEYKKIEGLPEKIRAMRESQLDKGLDHMNATMQSMMANFQETVEKLTSN
jgi:hypothetical protein